VGFIRIELMNNQRGIILELAALVIVGAAFAGLWTFYHIKDAALVADNVEKGKTITTMGQEKATYMESNTAYEVANKHLGELLGEQKSALVAVKLERNDKAKEAADAKKAAAQESLGFKAREAKILAQVAGVDWCKTWDKMVTDYTTVRQAGGAK
jgi:hypothetical protein